MSIEGFKFEKGANAELESLVKEKMSWDLEKAEKKALSNKTLGRIAEVIGGAACLSAITGAALKAMGFDIDPLIIMGGAVGANTLYLGMDTVKKSVKKLEKLRAMKEKLGRLKK